jgi:cobaltochelatase CobN
LRNALGLTDEASLPDVDAVEATARELIYAVEARGWSVDAIPAIVESTLGAAHDAVAATLRFACQEVVPSFSHRR